MLRSALSPSSPRVRRRRTRSPLAGAVAVSAALVLLAGGCSRGGDREAAAPKPIAAADTTTTAPPTVPAPLTGLAVDPEAVDRPAVAVKIDNSKAGRPQAGLADADVIYEERVEGGVTRFLAVFHATDSDLIGPIRSVRTTDTAIVAPLDGIFVFSGGANQVMRKARAVSATVSEREGAAPFIYPKDRQRPLKTFSSTAKLRAAGGKEAGRPPALFSFLGQGEQVAGGSPVTGFSLVFGPRTTAAFEWDTASGTWLRTSDGTPHTLTDGSRLAVTNVIVQPVPYRYAGYQDSSGSRVDEAVLTGSGEAALFTQGKRLPLRWSKPAADAVTTYSDPSGQPLRLPPGRTMVLLPASGTPVSVTAPAPQGT